ncbi:FAD-dependent monooxygenase [Brevibacillus laterosporus]|uniref:FAD-dependent monooxygenase n=1 Tax=Brevibacillus laterosporus TaxID=1465 RepID=UPI0014444F30|nr:FAD-dependent monooxygenase [Brevibacillus laterosporus]NKQ18875.1 monooxygenase [Brevibacillus laterosporus]WNX29432.1 FAD-dependent monooxygenase [Brevibacillus laterosporus]
MKILISGSGIAGLTLANCLLSYGYQPVVIEKASSFRSIGSVISLRGDALFVLSKLGLLEHVKKCGVVIETRRFVHADGSELRNIDFRKFHIQQGGSIGIHRFSLHQILYEAIKNQIDIRFNTTIQSFTQNEESVQVCFQDGKEESFDFVFGADGIHSQIRKLIMGNQFEEQLDVGFSVFTIPKPAPLIRNLDTNQTLESLMPGYYVQCGMDEEYVWGMFIYKQKHREQLKNVNNKEFLLSLCKDITWGIKEIIEQIDNPLNIFQDTMTLVKLSKWSQGRIVLVGDAAHAMTFMSGTGGGKSMLGAYHLVEELMNCSTHNEAFQNYESYLKHAVQKTQKKSIKAAHFSSSDNRVMVYFKKALLKYFPTFLMNAVLKNLFIVKPQNTSKPKIP